MRNFIDIVTNSPKPSTQDKPNLLAELNRSQQPKPTQKPLKAINLDEASWHQQRRPVDVRSKSGKWTVHDDPPGEPAGAIEFGTEDEAKAYVQRRKDRGNGDHLHVYPPHDEASLAAKTKRRR